MHPIERLRYVARASGEGTSMLLREAASALAGFSSEPAALVTACRRLVDRQPHAAALWWLAARVLAADEPAREAWATIDALDEDTTPLAVADALPEEATVLVLGWPELVVPALARRGDVHVLVVDAEGNGSGLVRALDRAGTEATLVEERGVGAAAAAADVVLIDAIGAGTDGLVAAAGSRAAAAVARHMGRSVWGVVGVGRILPGRLWDVYLSRLHESDDPWDSGHELVPLDLFDALIGPDGAGDPAAIIARSDCPPAPELLKSVDSLGAG